MPSINDIDQGRFFDLFSQLLNIMQQERNSSGQDPLRDLSMFRVNPSRGFLAKKGGKAKKYNQGDMVLETAQGLIPMAFLLPGQMLLSDSVNPNPMEFRTGGALPSIPAGFQLDSINNTPSNLPGGAGGKFDLSQVALQENETFTIPKMQPFFDPIFGNKVIQRLPFHRMDKGGVAEFASGGQLERLKRRRDRLERKGKTDTRRFKRLNEKIAFGEQLNALGDQGFNFNIDPRGTFTVTDPLGSQSAFQLPERGLSRIGSNIGNIGQSLVANAAPVFLPFGLSTGIGMLDQLGQPQSGLPAFQGLGTLQNLGGMGNALGQLPFGNMFGSPFTPGFTGMGNVFDPFGQGDSLLAGLQPRFDQQNPFGSLFPGTFQHGGQAQGVNLVPIQTERGEMIIHLDGTITKVNTNKLHKQMEDDEVTDIIPEGSYITSADKKIRMTRKEAEDILMGVKVFPYKEDKQGKVPQEILFADLWPGNSKRKMTAAELTDRIKKKYKTVDKEQHFGRSDIFTETTNKANLLARLPWLQQVIQFNEDKRGDNSNTVGQFKHGGRPLRMSHVTKAQQGLSNILNIAGTALPLISSLFGGGNQGGVDPLTRSLILGSLPLDQAGFQANIGARRDALGTAINDFTGLGQNLNQFAFGQAGANILGAGLQETDLPEVNFNTSRLQNFRTRAPRSFINALRAPQNDLMALAPQLGRRQFQTLAVNELSDRTRRGNEALINQFNQDRGLEFNIANRLTDLGVQQDLFNNQIQQQEVGARNARTAGVFGGVGDLFNQLGNIQSQILPITTGLNMQRANLVGQPGMRAAQNLLNAGTLFGSLSQPGQGGGSSFADVLKNLFGRNNTSLMNSPQNQQLLGLIDQNRVDAARNDFIENARLLRPELRSIRRNI